MIEILTAYNLKSINYSESSMIINVFSKEKGKQSLIAKGCKKSKVGNQAKLNTFRLNKYHVVGTEKSMKIISVIETIKTYEELLLDYEILQASYQIIWIINQITQDNHVSPELFFLTKNTLDSLCKKDKNNISEILNTFKEELLFLEGLLNTKTKTANIKKVLDEYIGKQMITL
jgi:DNA repair protein RecO (recombination protein O)